ncbi:TIGR02217 family protein [Aestuariivirga sp.]|uniref:phage distal tail protein, Rcc01695 family n=1 Tax=Aestuariivirga sp. TaxID=2650926 RepID=UPI0035B4C58D
MSFDDVRFPPQISRGSTGGPERRTEIVVTGSGMEERNSRWAHSRRRYNAGFGVKSLDDIQLVVAFFEERRGRLHGFRWKDHLDFKSCAPGAEISPLDQAIGTGDDATRSFQLVKRYGAGLRDYLRSITKPVAGSLRVAVNGQEVTGFSLDAQTGVVTLAAAPPAGAAVTAGFAFDVPVRFDTDALRINLAQFAGGDIPDIPILEIRA